MSIRITHWGLCGREFENIKPEAHKSYEGDNCPTRRHDGSSHTASSATVLRIYDMFKAWVMGFKIYNIRLQDNIGVISTSAAIYNYFSSFTPMTAYSVIQEVINETMISNTVGIFKVCLIGEKCLL